MPQTSRKSIDQFLYYSTATRDSLQLLNFGLKCVQWYGKHKFVNTVAPSFSLLFRQHCISCAYSARLVTNAKPGVHVGIVSGIKQAEYDTLAPKFSILSVSFSRKLTLRIKTDLNLGLAQKSPGYYWKSSQLQKPMRSKVGVDQSACLLGS